MDTMLTILIGGFFVWLTVIAWAVHPALGIITGLILFLG